MTLLPDNCLELKNNKIINHNDGQAMYTNKTLPITLKRIAHTYYRRELQ